MHVVDEENPQWPGGWILLEHDGAPYINAYCSHGPVDYDFLMALNSVEQAEFERQGRSRLSRLAGLIHHSAPAALGSRSQYKARHANPELREIARQAIAAWEAERAGR